MMKNWLLTKIRYEKTMENRMVKKVTEFYLIDALSPTEAEARIIEKSKPFISGEFTISDISRANYFDLFDKNNGDKYYDCKVGSITIDQKTAKKKKTFTHILVLANNIDEAKKNLDEGMKGTLADYIVDTIRKTKHEMYILLTRTRI